MIRTLFFLLALFAPAGASAMTQQRLESCWGNIQPYQVGFTEVYNDGSRARGTFVVESPSTVRLRYHSGAETWFTRQKFHVRDHVSGRVEEYPGGTFTYLMRRKPQLGRVATQIMPGDRETGVRLHDPSGRVGGHVDVYFDNNCRMVRWETRTIVDGRQNHVDTHFGG